MNSISVAAAQINGVFKSLEDACKRENIDINYAFVIQLRDILRYEQQNIQEKLPGLLKKVNSRVKIPSKISDLIRKIENKFDKANTEELKEKVLREVLLLSEDSTVIGIHCSKFRIFSNNLYNFVCGQVTNGVVYELEKFRSSNNYTFTELTKWVHNIVGLKSETFSENAMRYSVKSLLKNRLDMSRKGYSFSEQFLNETYTYPKMGTNKASSTDNLAEGCENPKCSKQKLKTIKCCQQIQNLNYQLQHEKEEVEEELTKEYKENQQLSDQLNKIIKDKTISDKELSDLKQKYETVINKLQKYNTRNINQKIQRRDTKLETINKTLTNEKEKSSFMEESVTQREKEILVLKEDKRNLQKKISYLKSKPELFENKQNENISKLRDENKELQESNAILQEIIEKCTKIPIFKTRKDGSQEFCDEMKKTYMELISLGVSCNMCSNVIKSVIKNMTGQELNDMPEVTFAKRMALQANLMAKFQLADTILSKDSANMLQFDGTSRWGEHFFTFDITTSEKTYSASLMDLATENSATQLNATKALFNELGEIYVSLTNEKNPEILSKVISKMVKTIHKTMSDRGPTNKPSVKLFEEWRKSLLPKALENWETLNEECQQSIIDIHDFYCGLHLLTNFADYSNKSLKKFEEISTAEKIGMKTLSQFSNWGTRSESAAQRLIRSCCNLLQIHGCETAGRPQQFNAYLFDNGLKNYLVPFRGNRFNILFQNARAVYGYLTHIQDFIEMYGTGNNLLLSVNDDIESKIALAGVRALGLVDVHINRPLWKLLDCNDVSITDMSQYYQKLHDSISNLVQDSSPMFDENYQMFENYPPEKDLFGFFALHAVEENNEELDVLTTQALELILASILSIIKRQLVDHLTGGKHADPNEDLMLISQSVPKTNQSNESNFGQLDRIKRFKPNATTAHIEGMVLYVNNKTSDWLDTQCNEADIMQKVSKLLPKFIEKWRQRSKDIKNKRIEMLQIRADEIKRKKMKKIAEKQKIIDNILRYGQCKSETDVKKLLSKFKTSHMKIVALKFQLKYYKCVLSFEANNVFYRFSTEGKALSIDMLKNNLFQIIQKYSSNIHVGVEINLDVPRKEENLRPLTERNQLLKSEKDNLKNVRVVKKQSAVLNKNGLHNSNKTRKRKLENEKEVTSAVKKHKRSHGVKINANMTFISNYKDFKVNQWIAVAGLSDWYIGQVKEILSEETATINFMERSITNTCTFKWCSPPAVETTYIKTVIHFDFDNEIGPNDSSLRSWKLEKNVCNQSLPNIEITALVLTKCESLVFLLIVL